MVTLILFGLIVEEELNIKFSWMNIGIFVRITFFFHFTYSYGSPNELRDIILSNISGNPSIFDIVRNPTKADKEV